MKALSLWQPWASLVALGVKRIETRSWQTSYRGPLAIHAAKRRCRAEAYDEPLYRPGDLGNPATLPLGAVVATCELVDCVPTVSMVPKDQPNERLVWRYPFAGRGEEVEYRLLRWDPTTRSAVNETTQLPFGDFTPGRWAWLLADIKPVEPPVPAKGHQQLWEWTP